MAMFDVSSIGFCVLDILGRHVTSIPLGGRVEFIDEIRMTVAGTAGATAVDCAILGLKTRVVTTVGVDDMGDFLVSKMKKFGVECSLVKRTAGVPTSATILLVRPNGERPALHVPGAADVFTVAEEDLDSVLDARVVHVGGTGLLKAFDGDPTIRLLKRAKALGRTTTLDLIKAGPETITIVEPLLPYVDYFIPSIEEAGEMAGASDPLTIVKFFHKKGARNCIVTLGGDGVYVSPESGSIFHLPAFDVSVVDTTGCGDSFTAGMIAGIVKGWNLEYTSRFANAVAAKVAMGLGSDGKLVSMDDTLQALETLPVKTPARSYVRL